MKTLGVFFALLALIGIVLWLTGLYPVALVEGQPILAITWKKAQRASENAVNTKAKAEGAVVVDFDRPEHAALREEIRRGTLTALAEDIIVTTRGVRLVPNFHRLVGQRVDEALSGSIIDEKMVEQIYGFNLVSFRELVAVPQARRDVINEALGKNQEQDFEEWLREAKRASRVRLLFVPFRWNGEMVE